MNLENLKSEWSAMNDRMERQEIFKEKIFCQMLNAKSDKSLSRLMKYEVISVIFSVLFIPVLLYMHNMEEREMIRPIIIGAVLFMVICIFWYGFKVLVLSKIDFTKTLKNNLLYINKYAVYIKHEKLIGYYFLIPLIMGACAFYYAKLHVPLYLWVFLSSAGIALIIYTIYFYRLYNKNISTIQHNLEELRELEEK